MEEGCGGGLAVELEGGGGGLDPEAGGTAEGDEFGDGDVDAIYQQPTPTIYCS